MLEKQIPYHLEVREAELEKEISNKWIWPIQDHGAWEGPVNDWKTSHSSLYFKHVKEYNLVVTAGANMGLHARAYAAKFKHVYAFEPDPLNFYCLNMNCTEKNVHKFKCALGRSPGLCELKNENETNLGTHTVKVNEEGSGDTPILTIDGLGLPYCDLIQLDVERFEYNVFLGAEETIKKFRPVIICEMGTEDITNFLKQFGYSKIDQSVSDSIYVVQS